MSGVDQLAADLRRDPRKALAAAAAAAAVIALALFHRKKAAPAGPGTNNAAGLVDPNTQATDIENQLQDMINGFQHDIDQQLHPPTGSTPAHPHPPLPYPLPRPRPGPPRPPVPAPHRPGPTPPPHGKLPTPKPAPTPEVYTIPPGGTLYGAAVHFYGAAHAKSMVQALAAKNGIKLTVRGGVTYAMVHPGQKITKA